MGWRLEEEEEEGENYPETEGLKGGEEVTLFLLLFLPVGGGVKVRLRGGGAFRNTFL